MSNTSARSEQLESELEHLLTPGSPFGPAAADEQSRGAAQNLYVSDNEIDHTLRRTSPTFLIGRRGSGKTAVLRSTYPEGDLDVELNIATMLVEVGKTIHELDISNRPSEVFPAIWEGAFVAALCARVHSNFCQLTESDCPRAFAFGNLDFTSRAGVATDAASRFLENVRRASVDADTANLDRFLDQTEMNGVALWEARQDLERAARRVGCRATISADSLDQYDKLLYAGGVLVTPEAQALQALFRAASETGRSAKSLYGVRVSFPAELWHFYSRLSENPLKDFDNALVLHWDGAELLNLCANRLLIFLRIHKPEEFKALRIAPSHTSRGKWASTLVGQYLPRTIRNGLGTDEPTLPYLLRHTQLLPRHLIQVLNAVFRDRGFGRDRVTGGDVIEAVRSAEHTIADTIIDAYRVPYPNLRDLCNEAIPRLPLRFPYGTLDRQVRQSSRTGLSVDESIRMLIEAGVVGRVIEVSSQYVKADFEYLHESQVRVIENDVLCLHPVFASTFSSTATKLPGSEGNDLPIYPRGSDYTTDDVRRNVHLNT